MSLSTGVSQWDTPTQAAPTGPTPQATPQGGLEHPYGTPGQQINPQELDIVHNADGSQSIRLPDGSLEPYTGERGLSVWYHGCRRGQAVMLTLFSPLQ